MASPGFNAVTVALPELSVFMDTISVSETDQSRVLFVAFVGAIAAVRTTLSLSRSVFEERFNERLVALTAFSFTVTEQ